MHSTRISKNFYVNKFRVYSKFFNKSYSTQIDIDKYSYIKGPEFSTKDQTLGHFMTEMTDKAPFANSIRSWHQRTNYAFSTVKKLADALAAGLLQLGLRPGDRLGFLGATNTEHVITMLACAKIGATMVEFKQTKTSREFAAYMDLFRPRMIMIPTLLGKTNYYEMMRYELVPELQIAQPGLPIRPKRFPYLLHIFLTDRGLERRVGTPLYQDGFLYGPFGFYETPLIRVNYFFDHKSPALALLDATGRSQFRVKTYNHQQLIAIGKITAECAGIKQGDRVMIPSYQDTFFGWAANLACLTSGATIVYPQEEFDPEATLGLLESEQCTVMFAAGTELLRMITDESFKKHDYSRLRVIVIEGGLPDELCADVAKKFNCETVRLLGTYDGLLQYNGKTCPGTEIKIVQKDGKIVPRGTAGFLRLRGPSISTGIYNEIGFLSDKVDEDGWLETPHIATLDEKGVLTVH